MRHRTFASQFVEFWNDIALRYSIRSDFSIEPDDFQRPTALAGRDSLKIMIGKPEDDIAPLETARQALETRLTQDENWRALQQLESREKCGEPIVAVESSKLRATLIVALERNRSFRAHRALSTAILALRGEDEQSMPSAHAADMQSGQPTSRPRTGNMGTTLVTNEHAVNGATLPQPHSHHSRAVSRHGNSGPTLTLKITTPKHTASKSTKLPPTAQLAPAEAVGDDLTRIWNIGNNLATRLNAQGIKTWQQIAEWHASDVKAISSALLLDRQIQRDGWIEQAALLLQRQSGVDIAPMPRCLDDASVRRTTVQAEARETKRPFLDVALSPKPTPAPNADAHPQITPVTVRDILDSIRGIDDALATRLAELGVTSFAQIAEWRNADIQTVTAKLDLGGRVAQQNWIEQAALLRTGQLTVYALSLASAGPKIVARPRPLALRTPVAVPKLSPPRAPTPQAEETVNSSPRAPTLTTPISTGGLSAALAKLGITDAREAIASNGQHRADNDTAATPVSDEPEKDSKPTGEPVPAPVASVASDAVRNSLSDKVSAEPEPATEPPDELDLQAHLGEKPKLIVVEKSEPVAEAPSSKGRRSRAPTRRARRIERPSFSNRKSIPGINPELAQTLADIDRLSDETEALLGNTKRAPQTPPDGLRDDEPGSVDLSDSELSSEEADVIIVSHDKPTPRQPQAAGGIRSAQRPSFSKKARYPNTVRKLGSSQTTSHRVASDEASVEIVEHGGKQPTPATLNAATEQQRTGSSIRRFLKALSGD